MSDNLDHMNTESELLFSPMYTAAVINVIPNCNTGWLYCVECPQYSTRLEALGYLCDCVSRRVQR